ncbi:MAG: VWA domain-containing protein [Vicinamibacterales bacterium]
MRHRLLPWVAAAALAIVPVTASAMQAETATEQPVFRSGVELVTVSATVRDSRGRLVKGLEAEDFEVIDNGRPRPITEFRTEDAPVSLAVLFDVSGSMDVAERMSAARFAARHLLGQLVPGRDEAALFAFDSRLQVVAPFTVDTRTLTGALGEVDPFGATSLHDAVAEAARQVADRPAPRRAVVVLTDGVDTASRLTAAEVSGIAASIDVPIYVIATVSAIDDPDSPRALRSREAAPDRASLEDLARWTGGALFYSSSPGRSTEAAVKVVEELRHAYLIAFPPGDAEGWHPIEVRTRDKDLTVRARGGYMAGRDSW